MPPTATADLLPVLRRLLIDDTPLHRHLGLEIVEHDGRIAFEATAELHAEGGDVVGDVSLTWHLTAADTPGPGEIERHA